MKDFTLNFVYIRDYLNGLSTDNFDFTNSFKTELFKIIQSRDLHRMMTNSGHLILFKAESSKMVPPLITSIMNIVKGSDFKVFVHFLTELFKQHDTNNENKSIPAFN